MHKACQLSAAVEAAIDFTVTFVKIAQALKFRSAILLIVGIVVIDQVLKFWIKTHMFVGQEYDILGHWFRIHFIENEGMAYGLSFGGSIGKIALTLFRLGAVIFGFVILKRLIREGFHKGLVICGAMILAGAIGNLVDSLFYGMLFSSSSYTQIAQLFPPQGGYAHFLQGKVVDMLYFPLYEGFLPNWIPFKGGEYFIFFQPVFNVADASISVGVITILLFQKTFFQRKIPIPSPEETTGESGLQEESPAGAH